VKQDCWKYDECRKPTQVCNDKCAEYKTCSNVCIHYGDCPFNVYDCPAPGVTGRRKADMDTFKRPVPMMELTEDEQACLGAHSSCPVDSLVGHCLAVLAESAKQHRSRGDMAHGAACELAEAREQALREALTQIKEGGAG